MSHSPAHYPEDDRFRLVTEMRESGQRGEAFDDARVSRFSPKIQLLMLDAWSAGHQLHREH